MTNLKVCQRTQWDNHFDRSFRGGNLRIKLRMQAGPTTVSSLYLSICRYFVSWIVHFSTQLILLPAKGYPVWRVSRITVNSRTSVLHGEGSWAPSRSTLSTRESTKPDGCSMLLLSCQTDKFNPWEKSSAERTASKSAKLWGVPRTETYILLFKNPKIPEQTWTLK